MKSRSNVRPCRIWRLLRCDSVTRNFPWRGPWTHGSAPRKGPLVHPQGSKEGDRNATKARKLSPKINVRRCSKHAVLLQVLAGPLDGQQIPGKACPTWKPAQVLCIMNWNMLGIVGPIRIVGLLHTPLPRNLIAVATLSLYLYIYMGILGFPQNRDKTRFHGQFVVPACSHKLLAITAITGSTSTNSTGTETGKPRAITCVPAFEITLVTSLTFSTFENLTQRFQRPKSRKNQGFSSSTSSTF